jgi:hypothetical protein
MKKIFVDKEEGIAPLVERVISDQENELVLVVPKNSVLKESVSNFNILKREADGAGKSILIETVDAEVLALANKAKIENFHPLFQDSARSRSLSDIRMQGDDAPAERREQRSVEIKLNKSGKAKVKITDASPILPSGPSHEELDEIARRDREEQEQFGEKEEYFVSDAGGEKPRPRFRVRMPQVKIGKKGVLALVALALCAALGVMAANRFFGKADVALSFKTSEWQQDMQVLVSKAVSKPSNGANLLPAEYLSQTKNTTQFFPASGRANVSLKAIGRIVIYNAYSSQAQSLVATTRFETPDGKIFRLDKGVTVPGAEVKDGKIIPSSLEADVTADKPGDAYNIGPIAKLTIPGFKGSPKFAGFYGELKEKLVGGATGERAVPTDADIASAKDKVTEILRSSLQDNVLSSRPEGFKLVDGASDLTVTRLTVNKATDEKGQFSVFGEAQYRAVVFREEELKGALLKLASKERADLVFRDFTITYKNPKPDFAKGELAIAISASGVLAPGFNPGEFKAQIAGKDLASARTLILGLSDLSEAKISLWPIWLGSVPTDQGRIEIKLD